VAQLSTLGGNQPVYMRILHATVVLLIFSGFTEKLYSQSTLRFESPQNLVAGGSGVTEAGFVFSAPRASQFVNGGGLSFRNPSSGLLNANGVNTVPYDASYYAVPFTSSEPVLQRTDGSPFQLRSMDLAAYSATFSDINTVDVTGYYAGGGTITTELIFNGAVTGQVSDFHTFAFDGQWSNLGHVVLFDSVPWASGVGFSIDNIVVSTDVPEPGTLPLVGLAVLGLVLRLRYRANRFAFFRALAH
jgi:hypothetical protein